MDNIFSRIRKIIDYNGISNNEFGRNIGCSSAQITQMLTHEKNFGIDKILKIFSAYPEISPEWLLTGQGGMFKSKSTEKNKTSEFSNAESTDLQGEDTNNDVNNQITKIHKPRKYMEKTEEAQEITLYDISAAANLKTLFTEKEQNILGKITLPNVPKCDGALYVRGDSMDPLIKSGDIVCYKEIYQLNRIIYGEMYLVSMDIEGDEYLTIKYVFPSDKGDGFVRLESFNKRHGPEDFEIKYITALALVKISIRMNTLI